MTILPTNGAERARLRAAAPETVFEELKRYVEFTEADAGLLRALHPAAAPGFAAIAERFYDRILAHEGSRAVLQGGESSVGRLKTTLVAWMDQLLSGPWDEHYYDLHARIGRVHVRINLPQHYMFGAMNVVRGELSHIVDEALRGTPERHEATQRALDKIIDLELAIMLHTYREDLLSQRARSERLSTFGQLVGSIGHELRNPLGVMETSLFILKGRVGEDPRANKHVSRIGEQLGIANRIITDLLDMIRDKPLARSPVDLAAVLADAVGSVQHDDEVQIEIEAFDGALEVNGDAGQLRQVFVNLLENAVHAVGDKGRVRIAFEAGAGQLEISVHDTGPGIDDLTRARLFEPLVTTKAKGIGLGLALVRRIVERHGGQIAYEPRGAGARFVVRLPSGEGGA